MTIHLDALKPGQALVRTYSKKTEMGLAIGIGGAAAAAMLAAMVFAISTADPTPSSGDCWCF